MNERVARSRALIAQGHRPAVVTRVLQVSRQSVYRRLSRRPVGAGPGRGRPGDEGIVEVAKANPTDGTRMVAALASRELGEPVNRKRVQRRSDRREDQPWHGANYSAPSSRIATGQFCDSRQASSRRGRRRFRGGRDRAVQLRPGGVIAEWASYPIWLHPASKGRIVCIR